ncbi:MAG: hypothetical protein AAGK67_16520 [Pseudomonadota bacterium]
MTRFLFRWLKRFLIVVLVLVVGLGGLIGYNELACIPKTRSSDYAAILPEEHHRPESRTLMTYPEWHIVHAYDDYAKVISDADPHDFNYLSSIYGFWSSLCDLSFASADHGGFNTESKQTIYVIGVSFTLELLLKAAYEETVGLIMTMVRGDERAPLDDVSAQQAADYAVFLQQTPWYYNDFTTASAALSDAATEAPRDTERRIALGIEYGVKQVYANALEDVVAEIGEDEPTLRMIVTGLDEESLATLSALEGVNVIGERDEGFEIETPRYRALTNLMAQMASGGVDFVEIAGNDDILFTAISPEADVEDALYSAPRQGYGDNRHLIMVKVDQLAERLRAMQAEDSVMKLEHINDY